LIKRRSISARARVTCSARPARLIKFNGFLAVYEEGKDEKDADDEEQAHTLPLVEEGERLALNGLADEQHFTEPPPRYTEATFGESAGREGNRASLNLRFDNDGDSGSRICAAQGGTLLSDRAWIIVNDLLVESFDDLFNVAYTAHMEEELDEIEDGKMGWTETLAEFYEKFTKDLKSRNCTCAT